MNTVLLDNGPLLTFLALEYLAKTGARRSRADEVLGSIRLGGPMSDMDRGRFLKIIGNCQRRLTTPHVLAEAFKLRDHSALKREGRSFLRIGIDTIKRTHIEEITRAAVDLSSDARMIECVCQLGLTDSVLLYLSEREGHTLLTDDKRLFEFGSGQIQLLDVLLRSD